MPELRNPHFWPRVEEVLRRWCENGKIGPLWVTMQESTPVHGTLYIGEPGKGIAIEISGKNNLTSRKDIL